ncbi:MAG: DUF885 domain-containing protein [Acidobacteriota bacterium]
MSSSSFARAVSLSFFVFTSALLVGCEREGPRSAPDRVESPVAELADRHAAELLASSPEWATQLGVSEALAGAGFGGRLADLSAEQQSLERQRVSRWLHEVRRLGEGPLGDEDRLTLELLEFVYELADRQNALGVGLPSVLGPVTPYAVQQLFGPHVDVPRLLTAQHPLRSDRDVRDWLKRLLAVPRLLDELATQAETDAAAGVAPPRVASQAVASASRALAAPSQPPLLRSFSERLKAVELAPGARRAFERRARQAWEEEVAPAYVAFADRVEALEPESGDGFGLWRLADGAELYELALEYWGANGLSAEEIHRIGLEDVARIEAEMDRILTQEGLLEGTVGERMARLAGSPEHLVAETDEAKAALVASLQSHVDAVLERAPSWFETVPSQAVEVRRIASHEEDSASGGYYTPPPIDGSRPGIFWINLKSSADVPVYTLKTLTFHEAVPGHHLQAAKALSVRGLPLLRHMLWFGDYGEGWALYAEALAAEMGLYEGDPLGDLGRLRAELYRAVRLVVDTGIHHHRWSRERAIETMVARTGESRASIEREIDRYAVWPGQAASYKLGMIQFQRLRARAERELGEDFDLRRFHEVVLERGAVPMPTLSRLVDRWIAQQEVS